MRIYKLENLNKKNIIFKNFKNLTNASYEQPCSITFPSGAVFSYTVHIKNNKANRGVYYLVSDYSESIFFTFCETIELYNILCAKIQYESNFGRTDNNFYIRYNNWSRSFSFFIKKYKYKEKKNEQNYKCLFQDIFDKNDTVALKQYLEKIF